MSEPMNHLTGKPPWADWEPLDLEAIREREQAATEGPWGFGGNGVASEAQPQPDQPLIAITDFTPRDVRDIPSGFDMMAELRRSRANGEFIAHARADIPALLAEVERLRAEVAARDGHDREQRAAALNDVADERERQEAKWGRQDHPNGTGPDLILRDIPALQGCARADHLEIWATQRCQQMHDAGDGTYEQILTEEWAEALAEPDPKRLRAELIQVAAVAVAWVEAIDRRRADRIGASHDD